MIAPKLRLNHRTIATLVNIICMIILVDGIVIYPMEEDPEKSTCRVTDLINQDLPQHLAIQYIQDWVVPYTDTLSDIKKKYKDLLEKYRIYEANLKTISQNPVASIMGGINYSMTLSEMKETVQKKFESMSKNGLIISYDEFQKIKDDYFYLPRKDLTRVWGAEYLKNKIKQSLNLSNKYDVPDYIVVMDNPKHIKISISFYTRMFPIPLDLENGSIYFKKIIGKPIAAGTATLLHDIGTESDIGFDDFSHSDNILKSDTGMQYIVDTEFRSFKFPISPELLLLLNYAAERFIYLNDNLLEYVYEFYLKD